IDKFQAIKNDLETKLEKTKKELTAAYQGLITRTNVEPHALVLDISKGRTLWDEPLGKVAQVNFGKREVVINIGSALGLKPETTFNVFGPGTKEHADNTFKGTIEVVRVLGPNTSVATITSIYDATGSEIVLNDPVKGRIQRETENPMKAGDLLFS